MTKITKNLASLYKVYKEDERIILEPIVEMPDKECWLLDPKNKEIVKELKRRILEEKATINWDNIKHKYK